MTDKNKYLKPNCAVIMAGGKGIRLRPLTKKLPKPLVKVGDKPILERIINHLNKTGIKDIYIAINYLGQMIEDYFGDGKNFGCRIKYIREKKYLGTGGALSLLPKKPLGHFVVMNADLLTQINFEHLLRFHQRGKFLATVCVKNYQIEIPFGVIETKRNKLCRLKEKPVKKFLINAGIYVLSPDVLKLVPQNQEFPLTKLIDSLLNKGKNIGVYRMEENWIDIGRKEELLQAENQFEIKNKIIP